MFFFGKKIYKKKRAYKFEVEAKEKKIFFLKNISHRLEVIMLLCGISPGPEWKARWIKMEYMRIKFELKVFCVLKK